MHKVQNSSINDGYLDLSNYAGTNSQQIGDQGVKLICTLDTLSIRTILLRWSNISSIGIAVFSTAKWDNLEVLILGDNSIGNIGCKHLSRVFRKNLKQLQLNKNKIEGPGVMHLSKAQWRNIRQFHISLNPLKIDGVKQLMKNNWKELGYLYMIACQLTFQDLLYLLMLHPQIKMVDIGGILTEFQDMEIIKMLYEKCKPKSQIQL